MMSDTSGTYLPVYVATENNYFSQGIIFLLEELFEDEFSGKITVSLVRKSREADLIVQVQSPGEKAFDWVDCQQFRTHNEDRKSVG